VHHAALVGRQQPPAIGDVDARVPKRQGEGDPTVMHADEVTVVGSWNRNTCDPDPSSVRNVLPDTARVTDGEEVFVTGSGP